MDLLQNPFYILGASLRDNKRKITELADDRSLTTDADIIAKARMELLNPRKRLTAELAWLPGAGTKLIVMLTNNIAKHQAGMPAQIDALSPLASVNYMVSMINNGFYMHDSGETLSLVILNIARVFENIDIEELMELINADRIVSGFPEIHDESSILEELAERRHYIRQIIKNNLDIFESKQIIDIMAFLVKNSTHDGETPGLVIIQELIDSYEIEVQPFIENEGNNINMLCDYIQQKASQKTPDTILLKLVNQLFNIIDNWNYVTFPVNLIANSKGMEYRKSDEIALRARALAVDLWNKHGKLELAVKMTEYIKDNFPKSVKISELIEKDITSLNNIRQGIYNSD